MNEDIQKKISLLQGVWISRRESRNLEEKSVPCNRKWKSIRQNLCKIASNRNPDAGAGRDGRREPDHGQARPHAAQDVPRAAQVGLAQLGNFVNY